MKAGRIVILGTGELQYMRPRLREVRAIPEKSIWYPTRMLRSSTPCSRRTYLKGNIGWERCFPFDQQFYSKYGITRHFDFPLESLDPVSQEIRLTNGEKLNYDNCLIATGASPVFPPIPGSETPQRAYSLRTAQSVQHLEEAISSAKKVIVSGGVSCGPQSSRSPRKRAAKVILLDVADQLLPQGAHASSAVYLRTYFEEHGVDVRLGCTLRGMEGGPEGVICHFPDDIMEEADFVAVCTGVRPNIDFIGS